MLNTVLTRGVHHVLQGENILKERTFTRRRRA
ncbi:hypothetical protein CDHC01_0040 [Corynebacterium diphtheriae HC01]|nr:hypothetical protein CD241_0041 [Corynebacterium diphtheriae 241]AEX73293.1 hypothetical protein CDHC01_0040 [Corynebacterium diphtheriae HC01]